MMRTPIFSPISVFQFQSFAEIPTLGCNLSQPWPMGVRDRSSLQGHRPSVHCFPDLIVAADSDCLPRSALEQPRSMQKRPMLGASITEPPGPAGRCCCASPRRRESHPSGFASLATVEPSGPTQAPASVCELGLWQRADSPNFRTLGPEDVSSPPLPTIIHKTTLYSRPDTPGYSDTAQSTGMPTAWSPSSPFSGHGKIAPPRYNLPILARGGDAGFGCFT